MKKLSFRAGMTLTSGTGFFQPIHFQYSWPLQKILIEDDGIIICPSMIHALVRSSFERVTWEEVKEIRYCWFGMRIFYARGQENFELEITAPGAYDSTMSFLREIGEHQHLVK